MKMNKLKRAAAVAVISLGLVGGSSVAANAATYGSPYKQYVGFGRCAVFMPVDYNWWEEVFQGKHDGVEFQYYAAC
jgi:hypothetical protein